MKAELARELIQLRLMDAVKAHGEQPSAGVVAHAVAVAFGGTIARTLITSRNGFVFKVVTGLVPEFRNRCTNNIPLPRVPHGGVGRWTDSPEAVAQRALIERRMMPDAYVIVGKKIGSKPWLNVLQAPQVLPATARLGGSGRANARPMWHFDTAVDGFRYSRRFEKAKAVWRLIMPFYKLDYAFEGVQVG